MLITRNRFSSLLGGAALAALLCLVPTGARAIPKLQLDILGGSYDPVDETVVTSADAFTVYAYLSDASLLSDTYYLSIALAPPVASGTDLGSFEVDGTSFAATAGMTYGVAPIEANGTAVHDGGDLGRHDVFETFFVEVAFQFDPLAVSGGYNTAETPGLGPIAGTGMHYRAFQIDRSALASGTELHFDLYSKVAGNCSGPTRTTCSDLDIGIFAPFSHDAGTGPVMPEPTAALLFAAGTVLSGYAGRSRRA